VRVPKKKAMAQIDSPKKMAGRSPLTDGNRTGGGSAGDGTSPAVEKKKKSRYPHGGNPQANLRVWVGAERVMKQIKKRESNKKKREVTISALCREERKTTHRVLAQEEQKRRTKNKLSFPRSRGDGREVLEGGNAHRPQV